jgi:hypothetical protein
MTRMQAGARLGLVMLTVAALAGCAASADEERLATLPRVPADPRVPVFPPALRGLSFRVVARIEGDETGGPAMERIAQACIASFEQWMGAAGWTPVRDPQAPADLVIEEHCTIRLSTSPHGGLLEMRRPETETLAIVVEHDGAPLVTVERGPADYVCESSGTTQEMSRDCMARAEHWAQAHILDSLIASPPLAELARQRATIPGNGGGP